MESLYELMNYLENLEYECYEYNEENKFFTLKIKECNHIENIVNYERIACLKNDFPEHLQFIRYSSPGNIIDLFEFLDDEAEFNDEISISSNENMYYELILDKNKFISDKINDFEFKLNFFIKKESFINKLEQEFESIEKELFKKNEKNVFIIGDDSIYLKNEFYMITNLNRSNYKEEINTFLNNSISNSSKDIEVRNELCNWVNGTNFLTPKELYINFSNESFRFDENIKLIIMKKTIDLILPFISNFTGYVGDRFFSIINGNKRIEVDYDISFKKYKIEDYNNLFSIYKWIYEESTFDKINICRNVISILVTAKCQGSIYKTILENSDWLFYSIKDNFELFLKGNIDNYFKEKNKIIDKIRNDIKNINDQITDITKVLNNNMVSLIGVTIAGVVGYIAKGEVNLIKILGILYLFQIDINAIFSLPLARMRMRQIKRDFERSKNQYISNYTRDNDIENVESANKFNTTVFKFYFWAILLITIIINYIFIKGIKDIQYINKILSIFGIEI